MDLLYIIIGLLALIAGYFLGRLALGKLRAQQQAESNALRDSFEKEQAEAQRFFQDQLERAAARSDDERRQLREELSELQADRERLMEQNARHQQEVGHLREKLTTEQSQLREKQEAMRHEFQVLANGILEQTSARFVGKNSEELAKVLDPLRHKIKEFEERVQKNQDARNKEQGELRGELKRLLELNQTLQQEARQLTEALKGDNKLQGNWGELVLERVLNSSGLRAGEEYELQFSATNAEGRRLQPDVVVHLPDDKHVIVDSKVSMLAYERAVSAEDEATRSEAMRQHIDSLRNHIKGLGEKDYAALLGVNSPDFVLMFIPIEASFGLAMQQDQQLFEFAWDRKIVLVTPSTLLATLRTIASLWKRERQIQNASEIAKQAGNMYDKFVNFTEDMDRIGSQLKTVETTYDKAMTKLTGRGGLISRAEKMKQQGLTTGKQINPGLLVDHPDKPTNDG